MNDELQRNNKGMRSDGFRLLCVGDIHLGRRPGCVPEDIEGFGIRKAELTPAAAWDRAVTCAIETDVDAVVLAGDVVESLDDRFEAYGHLERGIRRLCDENIDVFGVAGNHDVRALPRLADHLDHFSLLGRGGKWEAVKLTKSTGAKLRLLGWSFPEQRFPGNPFDNSIETFSENIPTIGILHCDVDGGQSLYAPVRRADFDRAPGAAWLLGHIHKPDDLSAARPIGYLGSLVGLDPGEPGLHGPWLASISDSGEVKLDQIPIAPLRYERFDLPIESIPDVDDDRLEDAFAAELRSAMDAVHDRIASTLGSTKAVGCRITLTGRSSIHDRIRRILANSAFQRGQTRDHDGVVYFIEKFIDQSALALDLAQIARGSDPPALLARRLICLQKGQEKADQLITTATLEIESAREIVLGAALSDLPPLSRAEVCKLLQRAGLEALEDLLDQRGDDAGGSE